MNTIEKHYQKLMLCRSCPKMLKPVVSGVPVMSKVLLVGQAPGPKEGFFKKPFAWTAGKTMFKWFLSIGITEEDFRAKAYMAAVCRCFPGKNVQGGGDRVPDETEIKNCSKWLKREVEILKPSLIIPVGKLAISQFIAVDKLDQVIGRKLQVHVYGIATNIIPLPHPSGASTWHRKEPGKTLLQKALKLIKNDQAFQQIL
ncbi:MAG: uracil-DNA glycosylase family protein [Deltaproteobacteria bacterium]|nr:uracil-DNA glycosylase family protein [Deltaproteobacteria bacterium]